MSHLKNKILQYSRRPINKMLRASHVSLIASIAAIVLISFNCSQMLLLLI